MLFFFLIIEAPPCPTLTYTLFPDTTIFRSGDRARACLQQRDEIAAENPAFSFQSGRCRRMSPHPPKRPAAPKAISPQADTSPLPVGDQRPSHEMIQKNHRLSKRSARLITAVHHNIPASKSEDLHRFSKDRKSTRLNSSH